MPGTGHSLAMFGKSNSLNRLLPDNAFSEISQVVKHSAEEADTGCASDHDSDSDYACEAPESSEEPPTAEAPGSSLEPSTIESPDSSEEPSTDETPASSEEPLTAEAPDSSEKPSTARSRLIVKSELSSDLQAEVIGVDFPNSNTPSTTASSTYNSALTEVNLPPGTVKWLRGKADPKKIIHVLGLPKAGYGGSDLHLVFTKFGRILDLLVLYRDNEAFVELDSEAGAVAAMENSKYSPVLIKQKPVELRTIEEIYSSVVGFEEPTKSIIKKAVLKLPTGTTIKCDYPCVVWVYGHSVVAQAAERIQKQLWKPLTSSGKLSLHWIGFEDMRLNQLQEKVPETRKSGHLPLPDIFILHLGGNDVLHMRWEEVRDSVIAQYKWLSIYFPDSLIIWSEILARLYWGYGIEYKETNKVVHRINNELLNLPHKKRFKAILRHKKLRHCTPQYFHPETHSLTVLGIDIFIQEVISFVDALIVLS